MIYEFACYDCDKRREIDCQPFHPPEAPRCHACHYFMDRVFGCEIDVSGCKDVDDIPEAQCISYGGDSNITKGQAAAIEARHHKAIQEKRKFVADGGNKRSFKQSMQIPAELYHSKIKQTGDKQYWDDPKNRNRHKSCKVN